MNRFQSYLQALKLAGEEEVPNAYLPKFEPTNQAPQKTEVFDLEALKKHIGNCTRCPLHIKRTNLVFGDGNPHAELMFVGEGPGEEEDHQGLPFVGRSGQLLTKIIQAMGLERKNVYIGNVVKCLKYNAMVQLGDGSWERIGRLVKQKYNGTVMSVNQQGQLVPKRVIGWHASPLAGRSVYKLSYKSSKNAGPFKSAIYLTGDHPVLTERGHIAVQELKKSDRIATGQGLSPTLRNMIYGSLLGDSHIPSYNSYFSFSHSLRQEAYARFKASLLARELGCTTNELKVAAGSDQLYPVIQCHTLAHRSLRTIQNDFYDPKKKVPSYLSKDLNPMMVAFWFMDDGYMRIRPPRQPSAEIATCAFSAGDIEILLTGLKNLGIEGYERRGCIFFDVDETKKFSKMIAPYVCPSMRYKLHPEVESHIPYDEHLFTQLDRETLYDEVEVSQIDHRSTDKTFYCIDVEETHNFVTVAGVVHNCRPPHNRNPEPIEIETCSPFLNHQIEIIRPKVIVCLGTFAAQTLLATDTKISMLRGSFHPWPNAVYQQRYKTNIPAGSIHLLATYHPSFLLRNPAMKKPVWEDMQKVMAQLDLKNERLLR
ncbi:MAG: hypothetical protein HYU97_06900 [Deltaproteobacteria bacterium]|nr:hypothetical protein [Deltaproteobacteria bacterium]